MAPLCKGNTVTGGTSFLIHLNKALSHVEGKLKFEVVFHSFYKIQIRKLGVFFRVYEDLSRAEVLLNLIG